MSDAFIVHRASGSGFGATITVISKDAGSVTVSNDDKSYEKIVKANGTAVFRGMSAGEWQVSHSESAVVQTVNIKNGYLAAAGDTVLSSEVNIVKNYEVTVSSFVASIKVTYPEGSSCECSFYDKDSGIAIAEY